MKNFILFVTGIVFVMVGVSFIVSPDSCASSSRAKTTVGTLMIGDSTTHRVEPLLASRHPDWFVDGLQGRPIRALPSRIESYLSNHVAPSRFIMALGTNASHDPDWTKERLEASLNKFPATTKIYLMMVVRAGTFQADKDVFLKEYNKFSREVSLERPNTWVINWRDKVLSDPSLNTTTGISDLLEDGTHQTGLPYGPDGIGVETYVNLIDNKFSIT